MDNMIVYLNFALENRASDLFITANKPPSVRINGEVIAAEADPVSAKDIDSFRFEVLGDSGEQEYIKSAGMDASYAISPEKRFRINFFSTLEGPAFVARPIRLGNSMLFEDLDLPPILEKIASLSRGLVVITGTTGSGKSTTLNAIINYINSHFKKHILMLEDPIEYLHSDIKSLVSQREINSQSHGFIGALRNALRENPDVIVIGELRDDETMQVAINAVLTGHLVLTTLHTSDTVQTIERMINMFPDSVREQIAADLGLATEAIISQRLVPKLSAQGMIPVLEVMLGTPSVKKHITDRDYGLLEEALRNGTGDGMNTFNLALLDLYKRKMISLEHAKSVCSNLSEFELMLKGMSAGNDLVAQQRYGSGDEQEPNLIDMRSLFCAAIKNGASDLLITVGAPPMLRVHGAYCALDLPILSVGDVEHLLHSIINKRQRIELEEKRELDFAMSVNLPSTDPLHPNELRRFRLNAFFQRGNLALVGRVIQTTIPTPEELKLPKVIVDMMNKKQGLILVTGPTGSGKSTTLASLINLANRMRPIHIVTIEDPIEYIYENLKGVVEQRELHSDTISFASGLRSAMRQAPDLILVGELRDPETISSALTAAETGHLILGTIHTNSAAQTVDRVIDSFPAAQQNQIRQQFSSSLLAIISQRLIRRVDGKGRVAAFEVMIGTPPVQALIREAKTFQLPSILETSSKDGMITLAKSLEDLYSRGLITLTDMESYRTDIKRSQSF